jgi:hypothetical protein
MDMFDPRVMLRAIELMKTPRTFLLDTFFTDTEEHTTEFAEIDIEKGSRKMAPFQRPISEGKVMERDAFAAQSIKLPYVKPKRPTTAGDMLKRKPGETVYSGQSLADRARAELGKDFRKLQEAIVRREEWMAAQALVTGKVEIKGDDVHAEIDFLRSAGHNITLAGGDRWSEATATIDSDLVAWRAMIGQATGLTGRTAVLGADVAEVVLHNEKLQKLLDNRRTEAGFLKANENPVDGVTYLGNLRGIDLWSYDEWYVDDNGDEQPMIPAKHIVLGATGSNVRSTRHYGAIQDLESTGIGRWFPKSWVTKDPSVRWVQLQSAPLPATHIPDAYVSAQVLS